MPIAKPQTRKNTKPVPSAGTKLAVLGGGAPGEAIAITNIPETSMPTANHW